MKTLKLTTKQKAMKQSLNTLFTGPRTATTVTKYSSGKYTWLGSAGDYVGREVSVPDDIVALWVERRTDQHGPYAQVMCLKY